VGIKRRILWDKTCCLFSAVLLIAISCTSYTLELSDKAANTGKELEIQAPAQETAGPQGLDRPNYVPGEVMVKFKHGVDERAIETIKRQLQLTTIAVVPRINVHRMGFQGSFPVEEIIKRLQGFAEVEYAEPNYIVTHK
jgi:hypothetical protein